MNNLPKFLDQDYLRLPTKNKIPLRKDWSLPINHYYKETLTIPQLLKKYSEYGIRLGLFIKKDYHLATLYFRTSQITQYVKLFPHLSYTLTENGLYYFILIKELPPNSLLKDLKDNLIGNFYGKGKLVIGANSLINNFTYQFIRRKHDYLTFNSLSEFLNFLLKHNIRLTIQGSVEFNSQQNEWFCPVKLNARWKKRNFAKAKLERENKLTKCLDCSRKLKTTNLIDHLTKIHSKTRRIKKSNPLRKCAKCHLNYSTIIKRKEHQQFYCLKSKSCYENYEKPN